MLRLQQLRTRYVAERYEHAILTTILQHQYYVLQVCRQVSVYVSRSVNWCVMCVCQSKCQLVKCLVRYFYCCYVTCTPPAVKCCSGAYVPYN